MKRKKTLFSLALACMLSVSALAQEALSWTKQLLTVQLSGKELVVARNAQPMLRIAAISFNFQEPLSVSVVKNTPDTFLLRMRYPAFARYGNETGPLSADIAVTVSGNSVHFSGKPDWAEHTSIRLADNGEHFFGLVEGLYPANRKSPDLRGEVVDVDPVGTGSQYHENYASVWSAFFMTNKGYASFFDSWAKGKYRLGINGSTELYHQTGSLDWYLITGPNGDAVLKDYFSIIGRPKFVPLWACGPIIWRDENKGGKDEILADARKMTDLKIPFTGWMVDRPYSEGTHEWSKMNFSQRFANPAAWIKELNTRYGAQFITWIGPMTFGDTAFPGLLPNFKGYIDLSDSAGVREFGRRLAAHQYSANVRGHKMDRAEEDFPAMSPWADGTPWPQRRAKYLYLYSKVTDSFLRSAYKDAQFNFARGAYHRCQPYLSAVWGGDSRSSWDGMAANLANAVRCGFMGFPVWGSDVGGYLGGRISEKLYARWLQWGAWNGLYEIKIDDAGGRGEDRAPWKYSEALQSIFRKYTNQRLRLLPTVFSAANTSYRNGVVMKPLAYTYPTDTATYGLWDQYLFTDAFLVAPMLDSTGSRSVYLPAGEWFDYYHPDQRYEGGRTIQVQKPLDEIPVFVRANAIWAEGLLEKGSSAQWDNRPGNLVFYYFPGSTGTGDASFDYVDARDGNKEKPIHATIADGQLLLLVPPIAGNAAFHIKLTSRPRSVLLNGRHAGTWDAQKGMYIVPLRPGNTNEIKIGGIGSSHSQGGA
ncbi:TIM-barrel domain-containing protein [Paraflavisolibacter sp. H34]|uniref:TIM-barrel domain-containing protein n=1 Tax=Huijunlia imazamoxiresistens TaxID=3127457 RepID=UPI0030182217